MQSRFLAVLLICALACRDNDGVPLQVDPVVAAADLSLEFMAQVGGAIGEAREARFLSDRYVVVLDRFSPHLRLFMVDGSPLWSGVLSGSGPGELNKPQAIATSDSTVLVFQRGQVARWFLERDTLRFDATRPLALRYFPMGAERGCDGGWLMYARDDDQLFTSPAEQPRMNYLFALTLTRDSAHAAPLWGTGRDQSPYPASGHAAVLIEQSSRRVAVLHRHSHSAAGNIVELTCEGQELRSHSENALALGDSLQVHYPRPRVLEWTAGVAAMPDGAMTAMHRYFSPLHHGVPEAKWMTELFWFQDGSYGGSAVLDGQWMLMDRDPVLGLLLTTNEPVPHFIRLPESVVVGSR